MRLEYSWRETIGRAVTKKAFAIFTLISVAFASPQAVASEKVWEPAVFDGIYVEVKDRAKNGCWTNIGEVQRYAEDQLSLAGFVVIDKPETNGNQPHPAIRDNIALFHLQVSAVRDSNGKCIGSVNSSFWASTSPAYNPKIYMLGQIGLSYASTVWDMKSINKYMFDLVKDAIQDWINAGAKW